MSTVKQNGSKKGIFFGVLGTVVVIGGIFAGIRLFRNNSVEVVPASSVLLNWTPEQLTLYGEIASSSFQVECYDKNRTILGVLVEEGDSVRIGDPLYQYDATLDAIELEYKRSKIQSLQYEIDENRKLYKHFAKQDYESLMPTMSPTPEPEATPGAVDQHAMAGGAFGRILLRFRKNPPLMDAQDLSPETIEFPAYSSKDIAELFNDPGEKKMKTSIDSEQDGTPIHYTIEFEAENPGNVDFQGAGYSLNASAVLTYDPVSGLYRSNMFVRTDGSEYSVCGLTSGFLEKYANIAKNNMISSGSKESTVKLLLTGQIPDFRLLITITVKEGKKPDNNGGESVGMSKEERLERAKTYAKKIRDAEVEQKQLRLDVQKLELQGVDGFIRATIDGTVTDVTDPAELSDGQPMITVRGSEGYYVRCTVDEMNLDSVQPGTVLKGMVFETNVTCTGVVTDVDTVPVRADYYYSENVNSSGYPVRIHIEDDSQVKAGQYIEFRTENEEGQNEGSCYLYEPYVRNINGENVIFIARDGFIRKEKVTTGKVFFGYVELLDRQLTSDDYIAFPYDKNAKDGAKASYPD